MAASSLGGNGQRLAARYQPMSAINVTPFVDVMLVLLVVFMVAAPLLTVGVPVDLPQTQAPPITEPKEPLVITINGEGHIFIQETDVPTESLVPRLEAITGSNPDAVLYVRGDKSDQLRPRARGDEPGQHGRVPQGVADRGIPEGGARQTCIRRGARRPIGANGQALKGSRAVSLR